MEITKEITESEQKLLMLQILKYIDDICRRNNINYSLIAGSLIGAIRHHGFIPWDDDIDIVLTKENYTKLVDILNKETGRYQTLKKGQGGEKISFTKLIDTKTIVLEGGKKKINPHYGIFVDIFCYYPLPNDEKQRKMHYGKIKTLVSLYGRRKIDKRQGIKQAILRTCKNLLSKIMGYKRIDRIMQKTLNMYEDGDYLVSNWPFYGYDKEVQKKSDMLEYTDVKFEDMTAMAFKNYDSILRTTFGNYMKLPPVEKRRTHGIKAFWK